MVRYIAISQSPPSLVEFRCSNFGGRRQRKVERGIPFYLPVLHPPLSSSSHPALPPSPPNPISQASHQPRLYNVGVGKIGTHEHAELKLLTLLLHDFVAMGGAPAKSVRAGMAAMYVAQKAAPATKRAASRVGRRARRQLSRGQWAAKRKVDMIGVRSKEKGREMWDGGWEMGKGERGTRLRCSA